MHEAAPPSHALAPRARHAYCLPMRAVRYLGRLGREFVDFAWQNKAWWIVPLVLMLLLLGVVVVSGSSVMPFIYTLF